MCPWYLAIRTSSPWTIPRLRGSEYNNIVLERPSLGSGPRTAVDNLISGRQPFNCPARFFIGRSVGAQVSDSIVKTGWLPEPKLHFAEGGQHQICSLRDYVVTLEEPSNHPKNLGEESFPLRSRRLRGAFEASRVFPAGRFPQ